MKPETAQYTFTSVKKEHRSQEGVNVREGAAARVGQPKRGRAEHVVGRGMLQT